MEIMISKLNLGVENMKKIEIKSAGFQRSLKKAIEKKPLVRMMPFSVGNSTIGYLVRGSRGDFYPVRFQRSGGSQMLGACLCAGGVAGFYCYHRAAALLVHSAFVACGLRPVAPRRVLSSAVLPPHLSWAGSDSVRAFI